MNMQNDGAVRTSDLGLAVYLYSLGAELTHIDRAEPRQAVFVFQLAPDMREELTKWQSGAAEGNLSNFWNSYRQLKLVLHGKSQ